MRVSGSGEQSCSLVLREVFMGCNYRPIGLTLGALLLASCAGRGVETTVATQQEPVAEEAATDALVVTGSRVAQPNLS
jgi:hypothetical protein